MGRVLIIGWGSAGKRFAKNVKQLRPEAQIFVLPNRPGDSSNSPAKSEDISFVNDWESAIRAEPQVAIIANPATYHFFAAKKLADIESDMLIEKPAAGNLKDAHHLADLLGKRSDVMVGYNLRYLPSLQEFRRHVLSLAEVSEFIHLEVQAGSDVRMWRPESELRETVSVNRALGGGVLNELSHELDYLSWFFGPPKSIRANLRRVLPDGFDVEDTAHLELHYGRSSGKSDVITTVTLDFTRPQPQRFCVVETDHGQIGWDAIRGQILEFKDGKWNVRDQFEKGLQSSYIAQLSAFLEAAESSSAQWPPLREAVSVCEIIDYARESSQLGTSLSYSRDG